MAMTADWRALGRGWSPVLEVYTQVLIIVQRSDDFQGIRMIEAVEVSEGQWEKVAIPTQQTRFCDVANEFASA